MSRTAWSGHLFGPETWSLQRPVYASTHIAPASSDAMHASMKRIPATPSCTLAAGQGARCGPSAGVRIQPAMSL